MIRQLDKIDFSSGFTKLNLNWSYDGINNELNTRLSCSNFNYLVGGKRSKGKERWNRMRKERGSCSGDVGGVVSEMREKLYQSDQSSILLQSPDKAGTAGGETMCIKTSWRSMASFCQIWERQKRMSTRNKRERRLSKLVNTKVTTAGRQRRLRAIKKYEEEGGSILFPDILLTRR